MRGVCRPLRLRDTKREQASRSELCLWRPSVALQMRFVYRRLLCTVYSLCVSVCVHTHTVHNL